MSCEFCRFAEPTIGDDDTLYVHCRRYPPVVLVLDGEPVQLFPSVAPTDWCGEWDVRTDG